MVIIQEINEEAHTLPNVEVEGVVNTQDDRSQISFLSFHTMESSKQKRGKEPHTMEVSQSPQNKVRGSGSGESKKVRMAEKMKAMSIKERCLMVEQAIYADEDLQEVPLEYREMWDYMEDV